MKKLLLIFMLSLLCKATYSQGFNEFYLQYNYMQDGETHLHCASGGFEHGFNVGKTFPLYIVTGCGLQYSHESLDNYEYGKLKLNMLSVRVPVNVMYHINIKNSSFSIEPYTGFYLKGNLYGELSYDGDTYDIFSDGDYTDTHAKRLQFGSQTGVNFLVKRFVFGICYGSDLTNFYDDGETKIRLDTYTVKLGWRF